MAKTIEQIQEMITTKYDIREVINEIADYLQANQGGSGGGADKFGIQDNLGIQNRDVDMQGNYFDVYNASEVFLAAQSNINGVGRSAYITGNVSDLDNPNAHITTGIGGDATTQTDFLKDRIKQSSSLNNGALIFTIETPIPPAGNYFAPISVNGVFADENGNITLP